MRRNTFGDPRPKGHAEFEEALEERNSEREPMYAELTHDVDDGTPAEYRGWSAEVRLSDSGDEIFNTLGYEERDDLVKDLAAAGIHDVSDL